MTATLEAPANPMVFEVPEQNYDKLVQKFAKYTRRARKCKRQPPHFQIIHEADIEKTRRIPDGISGKTREEKYFQRYVYVIVVGERPSIDGWEFIATIEHDGEDNLIRGVPGMGEIPVRYRTATPACEHCQMKRLRNETFVIRKQSKRKGGKPTYKQVGRNCLADFLPGISPEDVVQQLEWLQQAAEMADSEGDEDWGGGGYCKFVRMDTLRILQITEGAIKAYGWLSGTKARETYAMSTASRVGTFLFPVKSDAEMVATIKAAIPEDTAECEAALEWIRSQSPTESEDYIYNLWVACKAETVRTDRLGLVCSLLPAYRRAMGNEANRKERVARPAPEWEGVEGERTLFEKVKLVFKGEPMESGYRYGGTTQRLLFVTKEGEGNPLTWWASNDGGDAFEKDGIYDIVATVKKHGEYQGKKQTTINRVSEWDGKPLKKGRSKNA